MRASGQADDDLALVTVFFEDEITDEDRRFLTSLEAQTFYEWSSRPVVVLELPLASYEALIGSSRVRGIGSSTNGEFVVVTVIWEGATTDEDRAFLESLNGRIIHEFDFMSASTVHVPPESLESLAAYDRTSSIEPGADLQLAGC